MAPGSSGGESSTVGQLQRKRAFHTRTKTGCVTCRIRKIRCDEQKPFCNKCLSTGRKCDGYQDETQTKPLPTLGGPASVTRSADSPTQECRLGLLSRQPRVPLLRRDKQELRSYHFFIDVAAPALAGVFDKDFWLTEIPQVCLSDLVVWHAAVSIGAVYESYIATGGGVCQGTAAAFAVQQFNAAVGQLLHVPSSRTGPEEKWRASVASVLFTYLCSIQGLHPQTDIHLTAAKKLLREFVRDGSIHAVDHGATHGSAAVSNATLALPSSDPSLQSYPVSYQSLIAVVASLEIDSQALHNRVANKAPEFLSDVETHTAWRHYTAPSPPPVSRCCPYGRCVPSRATPTNLTHAGRAYESLLNALITLSQQNGPEVARFVDNPEANVSLLETLVYHQKPHARAFCELDVAVGMLTTDTDRGCPCFETPKPRSSSTTGPHHKRALDALRLFRATCWLLFYEKPTPCPHLEQTYLSPTESPAGHTQYVAELLNLAESILRTQPSPSTSGGIAADLTPVLSPLLPLLFVAYAGPTAALRRRAIELLRQYPRREGLWDSLLAAALAETAMEWELAVTRTAKERGEGMDAGNEEILDVMERSQVALDDEGTVPSRYKIRWATVTFTGAHSARMEMQTFEEWIAAKPGMERAITW